MDATTSTPNATPEPVIILDRGPKSYLAASQLHALTFLDDPFFGYLLHDLPPARRHKYFAEFIRGLMCAASLNHAIFDEVRIQNPRTGIDSLVCSTVWIPPGHKLDNPLTFLPSGILPVLFHIGLASTWRTAMTWPSRVEKVKKVGLRHPESGRRARKFYYVAITSTEEGWRGRGLCSRLMREGQRRAGAEQVPIWLEATTEVNHRLYRNLGFQDVRAMRLGQDEVDDQGRKCMGGQGIVIWAMVWWPDRKEGEES